MRIVALKINERRAWLANSTDAAWNDHLWHFTFGAYGDCHVLVWARGVEDALEEAASMLKERWPGYFVDDDTMTEAYEDAKAEGASDEDAWEAAEVDLTYTESGYLPSWEWWVDEVTDPAILRMARVAAEMEIAA